MRFHPLRHAPLRVRLLAIALVAVLPVALLSVVNLVQNARAQRAELERSAMETVRALSTAVDNELNASIAALEILATSPALADDDLGVFYADARRAIARHPAWDNVALLDVTGRQLVNLRRPFGAPLPHAVDASTIATVAQTGKPVVSDLVTAPLLGEMRFVVRVPVLAGDRVMRVLTASNKPRVLGDMLAAQKFPENAVVAIVDANGRVVARSKGHAENYGRAASETLRAAMARAREGFAVTTTLERTPAYTAFTRSSLTGWTVAMGIPRDEIDNPVIVSYAVLALAVVLSLALGIWGSLVMARTVTRPMERLQEVARGIGTGQLPEVPDSTIPEVRDAIHALMRAHTEREGLLRRERDARALAEEGSRSKDEFLAMLGHELRNPLAAIASAVTVIERSGGAIHPAGRSATGIIQRQAHHLGRLLDDLLDVGRVMTGRILLERAALDLAGIARRAAEGLKAVRSSEGRAIELDLAPAWINADQSRIEQIVTNLLTNATKYTPAQGRITVSVKTENGTAVLRVRDTGLGLEPELLPNVFDLFVQGHRTLDRAEGGLGIGLTLVRRLAELHGGSVTARSEGPGRGSEFEVRLPAIAPPPAAPASQAGPRSVTPRSVLIVEDNADAREMLKILLEMAGHRVHEAGDGPSGVRLALEIRPDVALIDIGLPVCDGYEVASAIRAALGGEVRLVALTGYGLAEDERKAREAGFDEHLVKPVDESTLARVIG